MIGGVQRVADGDEEGLDEGGGDGVEDGVDEGMRDHVGGGQLGPDGEVDHDRVVVHCGLR